MYVLKYSYCRRSGKFNPPPHHSNKSDKKILILFICNLNFSCIIPDNIYVVGCTVFLYFVCMYRYWNYMYFLKNHAHKSWSALTILTSYNEIHLITMHIQYSQYTHIVSLVWYTVHCTMRNPSPLMHVVFMKYLLFQFMFC